MADLGNIFGQMGSSAIGGLFQLGSSALNYKYQKQLAEQQNQFNLDMWRMNNEYNSPQAQMKRFEQAGLNPNLIYGQGTSGNSSSPPQMITPQAPKFDKAAAELSRAFNIEGIRTMIANRQKAQADANKARADAADAWTNHGRNVMELEADKRFGEEYTYNPLTGMFVKTNTPLVVNDTPAVRYYTLKRAASNYHQNYLYPSKHSLFQADINSRNADINYKRILGNYLQPQILMRNYDWKFYPATFWIDRAKGVGGAINSFINPFKF